MKGLMLKNIFPMFTSVFILVLSSLVVVAPCCINLVLVLALFILWLFLSLELIFLHNILLIVIFKMSVVLVQIIRVLVMVIEVFLIVILFQTVSRFVVLVVVFVMMFLRVVIWLHFFCDSLSVCSSGYCFGYNYSVQDKITTCANCISVGGDPNKFDLSI